VLSLYICQYLSASSKSKEEEKKNAMKKNVIRTITAAVLAASLAGCGSASTAASGSASADSSDKVIKVGASSTPHAEILNNVVKDVLAEDGWTLEVTEFTDYVTPNTALEEGSLDANYFQTLTYMEDQNKTNGLHLAAAVGVHIEPMGIYSSKLTSLDDLQDGAEISLPNDADNLDRGLRVLVQAGLLKDPGTTDYVTESTYNGNSDLNPHNYKITPVEAAQVSRTLDDVDIAVINGNYALEASLPSTHPAIYVEQFDDAKKIARTNFIVVEEDQLNSEKTKALVKAITSDKVKQYIDDTYKGSVIASFIDENGNPVTSD
jgi:D-methionine transport system substrate-binding protein